MYTLVVNGQTYQVKDDKKLIRFLRDDLEAVKDIYDREPYAGVACAMKNAGVGVGLPDWGRCRLLVTGEAARRAAEELRADIERFGLCGLEGREYHGEYLAKTDKMGSDVPHPVSHVAYGYAAQLCALNEDGTVKLLAAAHDVGKAVNPISVEGQIEGGVVMGMGYALTEQYVLDGGEPKSKFGTLGLLKADKVPDIRSVIIEKPGVPAAYGAIGIGEITSIPTAPAIAGAYYKWNGQFQTKLPLTGTPYKKEKK